MNEEEAKYIINKLNNFVPDCGADCYNCEFGVIRSYGDNYTCSVNTTIDLLYTKFFCQKDWEKWHG